MPVTVTGSKMKEPTMDYILQLYITGATQHSMLAVRNIKQLCEQYLAGRYKLEIIDVYQQPVLAEQKDLIATPTLLRVVPVPAKRFVGDMSDTRAILKGLDIGA